MKRMYQKFEIQIVVFTNEDIVTLSNGFVGNEWDCFPNEEAQNFNK